METQKDERDVNEEDVVEREAQGSEIDRALRLLAAPGQVVEMRVVGVDGNDRRIDSGYFGDMKKLAQAAARYDGKAEAVYITLNPVNPNLLARASNRMKEWAKHATSDREITGRRWLLIDCDPVRPSGISSTQDEYDAAKQRAQQIHRTLQADGWPIPVAATSGNGFHLLYRIDLPCDDDRLVERVLKALAFRFDDDTVKVDTSVYNPARLCKLYGTMACKGDDTPERPHCRAELVYVPSNMGVVTPDLLEAVASTLPDKATKGSSKASRQTSTWQPPSGGFNLDGWIERHELDVDGPFEWQNGRKWVFNVCPWNEDHTNRSAFILQLPSGAIAAGCHHNGCSEKKWHDLRDVVEPGWHQTGPDGESDSHTNENDDLNSYNSFLSSPDKRDGTTDGGWPKPLRPDAYYGLPGDIVEALSPHTEADDAALLVQFLVAFGNVIGRGPHFRAEADKHFTNLFAVLVGDSAKGRKGTSWGYIRKLFEAVDEGWVDEHIGSGLSSGEGLIWSVRDPITRQEAVKEKGKRTGETETVVEDYGVEDKRMLVMESEYASVLKVLQRDGNTLSALVRNAWDTGKLQTMTKNSPAVATGAHVSILGHITKAELVRYLDSTEAGNGFGNRFLWFAVQRSKMLPDGGDMGSVDYDPLVQRLRDAVAFAALVEEMRRDEKARALWHRVYPSLSEGKPGLLGAMVARAEAQVMRIALLYALLDCSDCIRVEHLKAALAVWEYSEASARWIFGDSMGDPIADEVLRLLRESADGLTRTAINNALGRNKGAQHIGRALESLNARGLIRCTREETGGRPVERWNAVEEGEGTRGSR